MLCGGGNLFWHGCNECHFYGLYRFQPIYYYAKFAFHWGTYMQILPSTEALVHKMGPPLGHFHADFALHWGTITQNLPLTGALLRKICPPLGDLYAKCALHWDTCIWNLPFTGAHAYEIFPDKARFLTKIEGTLAQMGLPWPLRPTLCISPCMIIIS